MVHLAANGCLVFTPKTPQMDHLFSRDEVVYFDSLQDFEGKIRYYLAHPDEAKTIAQSGYKRAQKDYDCKVVTATMVKQIFS
jgi:spore maturation protein CgeB